MRQCGRTYNKYVIDEEKKFNRKLDKGENGAGDEQMEVLMHKPRHLTIKTAYCK